MTKLNARASAPQAPTVDILKSEARVAAGAAAAAAEARAHAASPNLTAPQAPVNTGAKTLGTEALAEACGVGAKEIRRWLRGMTRDIVGRAAASELLPGRGGAYAFSPNEVEALARAFRTRGARKATSAPATAILDGLAARESALIAALAPVTDAS